MPVTLHADITGAQEYLKALSRLSPKQNTKIMVDSLTECALRVQENAAKKQILGGGQKAIGVQIKPHPTKLTSRTGTLRRSISTNRQPLPLAIEVGTDLIYGRIHEIDGAGKAKVRRPFLAPAVEDVEDRFPAVFLKHWRRISGE